MLKDILEDTVERACTLYPFFVERCVMFILRSACELISTDARHAAYAAQVALDNDATGLTGLTGLTTRSLGGPPSPSAKLRSLSALKSDLQYVWLSMRFLRMLPVEVVNHVSDRMGAALWSFIRLVHSDAYRMNACTYSLIMSSRS